MNSQFYVPKPCHENWDAMSPEEKGRFCSICSKAVTDFTQMSNEQIVIYLRHNSSNRVCGRFRNDQLEEKVSINIPTAVLYSQTKFINIFLLALLVSMGSMLFSCGNIEEHDPRWDAAVKPIDSLPILPDERMGHTVGIVASPNDTIAVPPPPVSVQKAPKSIIKDVRVKPKTLMGEGIIDSIVQNQP